MWSLYAKLDDVEEKDTVLELPRVDMGRPPCKASSASEGSSACRHWRKQGLQGRKIYRAVVANASDPKTLVWCPDSVSKNKCGIVRRLQRLQREASA